MKQRLQHIMIFTVAAMLVSLMGWSAHTAWKNAVKKAGPEAEIGILPKDKHYILKRDIMNIVRQTSTAEKDKDIHAYLKHLENRLENHPLITRADVWFTPDGKIHIRAYQIEPIALAETSGGWKYLTREGEMAPVSPYQKTVLPKIKGVGEAAEIKKLYPLMEYIYTRPSLRNAVKSLRYDGRKWWLYAYTLPVPAILGDTTGFREKLYKYRVISSYLHAQKSYPYTGIDLRYKNQIVCSKNL